MSSPFQSWLAPQLERFVAIKRAGGAKYQQQPGHLAQLDRYLLEHAPEPPLRQEILMAFVAGLGRQSPEWRDKVVRAVWQALARARLHGAEIDSLPPRPPRVPRSRQRFPRIVCDEEIGAIMAEARRLPKTAAHQLRPSTYATLYGLLFTTGIRIDEALALNVGDLDPHTGLLTIECGKFGKSRVLPVRASTVAALQRYIDDPRRPVGRTATMPLFVSRLRRRLGYTGAAKTFRLLRASAGIAPPLPRLHCLRHSFAVHRVLTWYRQNRDVNALLPALSTYLGHVSVENTWVYLQANGLLLQQAGELFARKTARLDEVLT
jgi:integrase/recombinase XerD